MPPDSRKLIFDIQNAVDEINGFIKDVTKEKFLENRLLQVGIERELEVIGEALNRLQRLDPDIFEKN